MTSLLPPTAARYAETYKILREEILQAAQLDAPTLDDAAVELEVDLEVYPFEQAKDLQVQTQPFPTQYAAFSAMMLDGFALSPWPEDSTLKELHEYQLYLVWAWRENNLAYSLLCDQPVGWKPNDAETYGLTAAQSAQRAYHYAIAIVRRQVSSGAVHNKLEGGSYLH
jgi:hypothetical protein